MASVRSDIIANRINLDVDRINRVVMRRARRLSFMVKSRARQALRKGGLLQVRDKLQPIIPMLKETLLASHAIGLRRGQLLQADNKSTALSLAIFDDAVAFLQRMSGDEFERLSELYEAKAFTLVNQAANYMEETLAGAITQATALGVHVKQGMQLLDQKFNALGMGSQKSHLLETLFRTNTQMAYGAGRWNADQDPAVQEILWGYEYTAVGDDRTRESHMAMDGTTLPKEDGFWKRNWPPNGWNCRCAAIPIFEEERETRPPSRLRDGTPVQADKGFDFNAGVMYHTSQA